MLLPLSTSYWSVVWIIMPFTPVIVDVLRPGGTRRQADKQEGDRNETDNER